MSVTTTWLRFLAESTIKTGRLSYTDFWPSPSWPKDPVKPTWWYIAVIQASGKLGQEDCLEFKVNLDYIVSGHLG